MTMMTDTGFAPAAPGFGWLSTWFHRVQVGQMARALMLMNDADLDRIGVTRADIPAHAEELLSRTH